MHTLKDENATLVDVFNLDCCTHCREIRIAAAEAGSEGGNAVLTADMPPFSHALFRIDWAEEPEVNRLL